MWRSRSTSASLRSACVNSSIFALEHPYGRSDKPRVHMVARTSLASIWSLGQASRPYGRSDKPRVHMVARTSLASIWSLGQASLRVLFSSVESGQRRRVALATVELVEQLDELGVVGRGGGEQRHRRTDLEVVGEAEDLVDGSAVDRIYQTGALTQPRAEHRVAQVRLRLCQRR